MYESYIPVYTNENGAHLKPFKNCFEVEFGIDRNPEKEYRLHTVGETSLFYQWRNELNYPELYLQITDALDNTHAEKSQYCIDFSSEEPKKFAKRIYKKEFCNPIVLSYIPLQNPEKVWKTGIFAKGKNVRIEKNGYLRLRLDINYVNEEKSPFDTVISPDETHTINFPEGTFDFSCLEKTFQIDNDKEISSFGIWIEGLLYSGEIYIESPFLINSGYNLIPDFYTPVSNRENLNWSGQNLSKKEWPKFRLKLNKKTIFEGEIFERCHRHSEWEISLPWELLKETNKLTYELISDYHEALSYNIYNIGIIEEQSGVLSVISTSYAAKKGDYAYCLIKTSEDNVTADISYLTDKITGEKSVNFEEKGLHGIKVFCKDVCNNAKFILTCKNTKTECKIPYIVESPNNKILLGTGDMVYVNQNLSDMEKYLCWYISNNIGNFLTIRPTYRWSGTRTIDEEAFSMVKRVLCELGIPYVLMTDGRELPGLCCNPTDDILKSNCFLGRQNHERDGKAYYWGVRDTNLSHSQIQFYDMMTYERKENEKFSQFPAEEYSYKKDGIYSAAEPDYPHDVLSLEAHTVNRLKKWRTASRHTGPSYMQKYLAKAGYDFLGAETMYSNFEMLLAIMRGVAKCFKMQGFGVHHALQWSTTPHNDENKYRRFYIALYLSYMLGATDINTEEGLWHLEEFFSKYNRFSTTCKEYTKIHKKFMEYINTHSRPGKFYTPFAFIHGICDGTLGFGEGNMWGVNNSLTSNAEKSWKTANVFYPNADINNSIYAHPCPTDRPIGYYSGTPLGNVDIIPMESEIDILKDYSVLVFSGYNLRTKDCEEKLLEYVHSGGTVLLTLAHMTKTTDIYEISNNHLNFDELYFTDGIPEFVEDNVSGKKIKICTNLKVPDKIIEKTESGRKLVAEYTIGKGRVILFNTSAYPGDEAIESLYRKQLERLIKSRIITEKIWIEADCNVEFSVYSHNSLKIIYLIAVDWYNDPKTSRIATLKSGGHSYKMEIPFGTMLKCVSNGEKSIWTLDEKGEILDFEDNEIVVQGRDISEFIIAENGVIRNVSVDFSQEVIQRIK